MNETWGKWTHLYWHCSVYRLPETNWLHVYFAVISDLAQKCFTDFCKKKQKQKQQPNNNKTGFFIHIQTLTWKFQSYAHMVCWQYSSRHCFSNKPLPSLASGGQCCSLPISFFPSSIWKEKKNNKRNKPGFQGATLKRTPLTLFLVLHRQFRIGKMHRNVPTVSYVLDVVN